MTNVRTEIVLMDDIQRGIIYLDFHPMPDYSYGYATVVSLQCFYIRKHMHVSINKYGCKKIKKKSRY